MFEKFKLVKILRAAHDCCLIIEHIGNEFGSHDSDATGLPPDLSGFSLMQLFEVCQPLMHEYARELPLPSEMRQKNIQRVPASQLPMEMMRAHGALINGLRKWFTTVPPDAQYRTILKVFGVSRGELFVQNLRDLASGLEMIELLGRSKAA